MAPLLNIIIRILPSLPSFPKASIHTTDNYRSSLHQVDQRQQQPVGLEHTSHGKGHAMRDAQNDISTIAWGEHRLDVFALAENNLTHKYWDGYQWGPPGVELETLGNGLATPPVAVTWGADRLDVFGLDDHNVVKHQYWDGAAWQPSTHAFENLGGGCDPAHAIAANTWGVNRLDIFCTGPAGDLLHQYYDGSQWQPEAGSLESLGGSLSSGPSVVSWGEGRLDVFGVHKSGGAAHRYWDGSQWSEWEVFPLEIDAVLSFRPTLPLQVTTWGENRLDVYGFTDSLDALLYHRYWDGYQWSAWGFLGVVPSLDGFAATSWEVGRHDIVVKGAGRFYHKHFNGEAWRPDVLGWDEKSPDSAFLSNPSLVSWGKNRLDIFGVDDGYELLHQAWVGVSWFPSSTGWETLGEIQ